MVNSTFLSEATVQVGGEYCTKQDYSVKQVTSKIVCINFSKHFLMNSNDKYLWLIT